MEVKGGDVIMNNRAVELKEVYNNAAEIDFSKISDIDLYKLADAFLKIYTDMKEKKDEKAKL